MTSVADATVASNEFAAGAAKSAAASSLNGVKDSFALQQQTECQN